MAARLAIGLVLVRILVPVSIDDAVRVYFAMWWFDHPSFSAQPFWPPGFFYVYGLACGLADDALIAPRLLTLGLALACGAVIALVPRVSPEIRFTAASWILFSPLSLVLGTVPLSESLYALTLLSGLVLLCRFLEDASPWSLIGSGTLYLFASMVRYEAWPMLVLYTVFACTRRPHGISPALAWALRAFPWAFVSIWMALLGALEADPALFVSSVRLDSYGPGDPFRALAHPLAWIVIVQLAASVASLAPAIGDAIGKRRLMKDLAWEAHLVVAIAFLTFAIFTRNVGSQYPIRVFFPVVVLASVPVARLVTGAVPARSRMRAGALVAGLLAVSGLAYAIALPAGHHRTEEEVARRVLSVYDAAVLSPGDHVLVDPVPPQSMSIWVYMNRPKTTHVDRRTEASYMDCNISDPPGWLPSTRLCVVRIESRAALLESMGWLKYDVVPPYSLYVRPPGAPAVGTCVTAPSKAVLTH